MAKVIVRGDLDLQKNKILNGGFEVVDTLPTADFEGRQVYNSQNKKLYICRNNGTSTAPNYKWEIVGSNIKTISKDSVPTTDDMSTNDIAYDEIFIWQDTTNSKSYLYQNVSGTPRKCGNEDKIQADLTAVETEVTTLKGKVATNTANIKTNTTNIETNTTNITNLQNNRFKVFSVSVTWTKVDSTYIYSTKFSSIDNNLEKVAGVTILIGNEEHILYTKIDNTNTEITITSNIYKENVDLIVYGWVSTKQTE